MKPSRSNYFRALAPAVGLALLAITPSSWAENNATGIEGIEAVASKVAPDYVRNRMPDGSFQTELYAFGPGGNWGGNIKDLTIDKLTFLDVARVIAAPLASQKYLPGKDPTKTKLSIMLYWGTTAPPPPYENDSLYQAYERALQQYRLLLPVDPNAAYSILSSGLHELAMENRIRDRIDFKNAAMLGYDASGLIGTERGKYLSHTGLRNEGDDEIGEIEDNRYFVVLMAYDFQLLWKQKKHKLLWETRFSINERHNEFDKTLPAMTQYAAKYFGQPSNGLVRERLLNDHVEIGEPTFIQFVDGAKGNAVK